MIRVRISAIRKRRDVTSLIFRSRLNEPNTSGVGKLIVHPNSARDFKLRLHGMFNEKELVGSLDPDNVESIRILGVLVKFQESVEKGEIVVFNGR